MHTPSFGSAAPASRLVLLLGAPRSGTTWLGKIFDSHPDVLYRHEPDTLDRGGALPKIVGAGTASGDAADEIPAWQPMARAYLLRLAALGRLKTAGQLPLFAKSYRGPAASRLLAGGIGLLRLLALAPRGAALAGRIAVPDLATSPPACVVLKSVSGCGCAGLYAAAVPEARIVFLLRAPFGQIASMLEGTSLGKIDGPGAVRGLWRWPVAARHGLTEPVLRRLTLVEQLAWMWVVQNETALADLAGPVAAGQARVLTYRDLRAAPETEARALFAFAGLGWTAQTAAFLTDSTRFAGRPGYFAVRRNTAAPERKWREVLNADDRARIAAIVRHSTLTRFLDPEAAEAVPATVP